MKRAVKTFPVPMIAVLAAIGAGFALASLRPERAASAADTAVVAAPARMIALQSGGAIVVDQGNLTYLVDHATGKATLVRDERGEPIHISR